MEKEKVASFLKKVVNPATGSVEFLLGNGQGLTVRLEDFDEETVRRFALHGISQKIGDSTANLAKGREYRLALETMHETFEACQDGAWNQGRQSSYADLIAVIARLMKLPVEDVTRAVQDATDEKRKEWLANKSVKAGIAELVAARKLAAAEDAEELDFSLPDTE